MSTANIHKVNQKLKRPCQMEDLLTFQKFSLSINGDNKTAPYRH